MAKIKPVVNQVRMRSALDLHSRARTGADARVFVVHSKIQVHPYNYTTQLPVIEFGNKHGIVTEGYSPLASIRAYPSGPVDKPISEIAACLGCTPEQALMAWAKSKGIVVITSSRNKERVNAFFGAGDLGGSCTWHVSRRCRVLTRAVTTAVLTPEDTAVIDNAGKKGEWWWRACVKAGKVLPYDGLDYEGAV